MSNITDDTLLKKIDNRLSDVIGYLGRIESTNPNSIVDNLTQTINVDSLDKASVNKLNVTCSIIDNINKIHNLVNELKTVTKLLSDDMNTKVNSHKLKRVMYGLDKYGSMVYDKFSYDMLVDDSLKKIRLILEKQENMCVYNDNCDSILDGQDIGKLYDVLRDPNKHSELLDTVTIDRIHKVTGIKLNYIASIPDTDYVSNMSGGSSNNDVLNRNTLIDLKLTLLNMQNVHLLLKRMYDCGLLVKLDDTELKTMYDNIMLKTKNNYVSDVDEFLDQIDIITINI
jgi:hypothetical protein